MQGRDGASVFGKKVGQEGLVRQLGPLPPDVEGQRGRRLHRRPPDGARQEQRQSGESLFIFLWDV